MEPRLLKCAVHPRDQFIRNDFLSHEGYRPYVYPDTRGIPTLGFGLNVSVGNKDVAAVDLGKVGLSYDDVHSAWVDERALYKNEFGATPTTSSVKDSNGISDLDRWNAFIKLHPPKLFLERRKDLTDESLGTGLLKATLHQYLGYAQDAVPNYRSLSYGAQAAVLDIIYQQGEPAFRSHFPDLIAALSTSPPDYAAASLAIHSEQWLRRGIQVGWADVVGESRAGDVATLVKSGEEHCPDLQADSVTQFSGVQGQGSWYYGYASSGNSFSEFPIFDGSWHEQPGIGGYWTALWADGGHPNGANGNQGRLPFEQYAVRRWISPEDGAVSISGDYAATNGGYTIVRILVDGKEVFSSPTPNGGTYSLDTPVRRGTTVDFVIDPAGDDVNDATRFTAVINGV